MILGVDSRIFGTDLEFQCLIAFSPPVDSFQSESD